MQSPADLLKDILVADGEGVFAATSGWGIYIGDEPDQPDTSITLYDTGGQAPNPKFALDYPTVQIRIRGSKGAYQAAYDKARTVRASLLGHDSGTIGDTWLVSVTMKGDIMHLGKDQDRRPLVTLNFQLITEPTADDWRVAL